MFVCVCNAISDRQIKETVAAGATSLTDLQNALGVATCCGCCADLAVSAKTTCNSRVVVATHLTLRTLTLLPYYGSILLFR